MTKEPQKMKEFIEFETKYRVDGSLLFDFKKLIEDKLSHHDAFLYIESDDIYYTKGESDFLRYRFSRSKKDKRAELTYKRKTQNANNILREEVNLRVDNNDKDTVEAMVEALNFKRNFKISKMSHIYDFEDVVLPFYTVTDEEGNTDHFMEIEVRESLIPKLTE